MINLKSSGQRFYSPSPRPSRQQMSPSLGIQRQFKQTNPTKFENVAEFGNSTTFAGPQAVASVATQGGHQRQAARPTLMTVKIGKKTTHYFRL